MLTKLWIFCLYFPGHRICNVLLRYSYISLLFVYLFCRCSILMVQKVSTVTYFCLAFRFIINFLTTCSLANFCRAKYCILSRKYKGNFTYIQLKCSIRLQFFSSDMFLAIFCSRLTTFFFLYCLSYVFAVVVVRSKNRSKIPAPTHVLFVSLCIERNWIHVTELHLQIILL